jgi:protein TonB
MGTQENPFAVPGSPSHQNDRASRTPADRGTQGMESSNVEVPIRVLGRYATGGPNDEFQKGDAFEEDSTTILLLPRGAVIRLTAPVVRGQDLMLVNKQTNRYAHCRVTNQRSAAGSNQVEVEFTHTIADYWGSSFSGDAASALAAFAAQLHAESLGNSSAQAPAPAPAQAQAAAAGVAGAYSAAAIPAPAPESAVMTGTHALNPPAETDEPEPRPMHFAPQPTEAVPVCEPVAAPSHVPHTEGEGTAPAVPVMNWEAIGEPEPRRKRVRIRAVVAAVVIGIILGYRFFAPAEASMPFDSEAGPTPAADSSPTPNASSAAAAPAESSASAEPSDTTVVSATVPEMETQETPTQHVVLAGKMTMPAKTASNHAQDAPELSPAGTEGLGATGPGKTAVLLGTIGAAPPPPPESAPESPGKEAASLTPARLVSSVQPVYPPAARQAQIQGNVVIEALIDASGNVAGMKVLSGPQALRAAATSALAHWKFQPALLGDRPTASTTIVTLQFQLR